MKKLMMFVAVLGLSATAAIAQETPAKTVKQSKKHKTEAVAKEVKAENKEVKAEAKAVKAETKAVKADAAKAKK